MCVVVCECVRVCAYVLYMSCICMYIVENGGVNFNQKPYTYMYTIDVTEPRYRIDA